MCEHIIVVNQPTSRPLNLKFRLWLFGELICMLLMSPLRCVHSVPRQRNPPCSQSLEKLGAEQAFQCLSATKREEELQPVHIVWGASWSQRASTLSNLFNRKSLNFYWRILSHIWLFVVCNVELTALWKPLSDSWLLSELLYFILNIRESFRRQDEGKTNSHCWHEIQRSHIMPYQIWTVSVVSQVKTAPRRKSV